MRFRAGLTLLVLAVTAGISAAAAQPLSPEQISGAIRTDSLSIPTPGELFAALSKPGLPNWTGQYRPPIPATYRSRPQIALNLGGLVADGFIAVEAQDSQQVKNTGADILKLAKALGVSENVLGRGKSINEFAENGQWDALQEELEATQNEVKSSMQSNLDHDFVILVSLGGWIRGTQVVSGVLLSEFNPEAARVLRQPALVEFIRAKVREISPELRDEPLVRSVTDQLPELQQLVTFGDDGVPSQEEVQKLHDAVSKLIAEIQTRADAR